MPYRINPHDNKVIDHFKGGHWSIKQRCSSPDNAQSALRLLNMKEHGVVPKGGWRESGKGHKGLRRPA